MTDWSSELAERLEDSVTDHVGYDGVVGYASWDGSAVPSLVAPQDSPRFESGAGHRRSDVARGVAFPGRLLCKLSCNDAGCEHCPKVAA